MQQSRLTDTGVRTWSGASPLPVSGPERLRLLGKADRGDLHTELDAGAAGLHT